MRFIRGVWVKMSPVTACIGGSGQGSSMLGTQAWRTSAIKGV